MAHHDFEKPEDVVIPSSSLWAKLPIIGGALGVAGLAATFAKYGEMKQEVLFSYLFGYWVWLTVALGCLIFVIMQHIVRAGWTVTVRRIAESAAMTLPLFALLAIPFLLPSSAHELFPWMDEAHVDAIIKKKQWWLDTGFFYVRAAIYFIVWTLLAGFFWKTSVAQDKGGNVSAETHRMWKYAGVAIPTFGVSMTLASFDWLMSLQPHWYSTIFGVYIYSGAIVSCFAFLILVSKGLQSAGLMKTSVTVEHYHDMGKFMFGKVIFWAYIGFSQFFIIWYANIPEETEFFVHRMHHGWGTLSYALPLFHFMVPFLFLLSRWVKRHHLGLIIAAGYMTVMHMLDIYWLVMPNVGSHLATPKPMHALDHLWIAIAAVIGVGGCFMAVFGLILKRNAIIPTGDPRLQECIEHENY
ncbi:MAG: hypothetical protein GY822_23590 [Deltaproteobacteria bacterium]|nr:hypothetical protein [Deltaproteobacteria bacterium]